MLFRLFRGLGLPTEHNKKEQIIYFLAI
jgi:hypothetical protein